MDSKQVSMLLVLVAMLPVLVLAGWFVKLLAKEYRERTAAARRMHALAAEYWSDKGRQK